jgi:hypothetical protein
MHATRDEAFVGLTLSDADWDVLFAFEKILAVSGFFLYMTSISSLQSLCQVPFSFQQVVSGQKAPTLSLVLPAYTAMRRKWELLGELEADPGYSHFIQAGLDKLEDYEWRTDIVPAYTIATRKQISTLSIFSFDLLL